MTAEQSEIRVLGISGSLRRRSFNTFALHAAAELAPAGMTVELANISEMPLYNEDVKEQGFPPAVEQFRSQIRTADALLIATPEYNYSISGVLKNAIDWASRPPEQPFNGKPLAMLGVSPGALGTVRAQNHLRQMLIYLNVLPVNQPEIYIGQAATRFDENGRLTDEPTREMVAKLMASLAAWTRRLKSSK